MPPYRDRKLSVSLYLRFRAHFIGLDDDAHPLTTDFIDQTNDF
jgi:hypothetical protein